MWIYGQRTINTLEDIPEGTYGFIYEVEEKETGLKYLGKKVLFFNRTLPPLKGKRRRRKVTKESDWKTYYGSNSTIKQLLEEKGIDAFERRILKFVPTKKLLTYYENKYLFLKGVIEPDSGYLNDNIEGRYYRKDFFS